MYWKCLKRIVDSLSSDKAQALLQGLSPQVLFVNPGAFVLYLGYLS